MKNKIVIGGIVIAIFLGVIGIFTGGSTIQQVINKSGIGSVAGTDLYNDYFRFGSGDGIRVWNTAQGLQTATTTVCSIQSPSATSTLTAAGIKIDVATTTQSILDIGTSASSNTSTSTQIGTTYTIAANAQAFVQASTTPAALARTVLAPKTFLNFNMVGGAGLKVSPSGACHASFEEYLSL